MLQCVAPRVPISRPATCIRVAVCAAMQFVAVFCSVLQCVALYSPDTRQRRTAEQTSSTELTIELCPRKMADDVNVPNSVLQRVAAYCSVFAVCCSVLQCVAVCCSVL